MGDPMSVIGTIAAITSLVKIAKTIYTWISDFRNAPEFVRQLHIYILAFTVFVEGVQQALGDPAIARRILPEQTNVINRTAKETLEQLRATLQGVAWGLGRDISRWKWLQRQHNCRDLRNDLDGVRSH